MTKVVWQYQREIKENPEPDRKLFIARERSYHGATLGALDLSGHEARRAAYEPMLAKNMRLLPPCYPYRDRLDGETDAEYVQRLKQVFVDKVEELGSGNVAGFIVEPVVGAVSDCYIISLNLRYPSSLRIAIPADIVSRHLVVLRQWTATLWQ